MSEESDSAPPADAAVRAEDYYKKRRGQPTHACHKGEDTKDPSARKVYWILPDAKMQISPAPLASTVKEVAAVRTMPPFKKSHCID